MARTLTVYLAADTSRFRTGMAQAGNAVDGPQGFSGRMRNAAGTLSNVLGPALAGAAGAAVVMAGKLAVDGVQAAIAEEAEITKLATALDNLGFGNATADVEEWISTTARATTFSDNDLRPAMALLAGATGSVTDAQKLLTAAMDTSVGTGKPLESITRAISKAVDGHTGALSKLVPGLDEATLESADLNDITDLLSQRFSGQAADAAATWSGKIGNVTEAFGELQESFGAGFLAGMDNAGSKSGEFSDKLYELQDAATELGTDLAEVLTTVSELVTGYEDVKTAVEEFRDTIEGTAWGEIFQVLENALLGPLKTANSLLATLLAIADAMGSPKYVEGQATYLGTAVAPASRPEFDSQVPGTRSITANQVGNAIYKVLADTDARKGYVVGGVLR